MNQIEEMFHRLKTAEMPKNGEELLKFVTDAFTVMMKNPDNALALALQINAAQQASLLTATQNNQQRLQRLEVVSVEYPNCIRAVVKVEEGEGENRAVTLELTKRSEETGDWIDADISEEIRPQLERILMTKAQLIPGEVLYLTTIGQVEAAIELASNAMFANAGKVAELTEEQKATVGQTAPAATTH